MDIFSRGASEKLALHRVAQVSGVAICTVWVSDVIIWNCLICSVKNGILFVVISVILPTYHFFGGDTLLWWADSSLCQFATFFLPQYAGTLL